MNIKLQYYVAIVNYCLLSSTLLLGSCSDFPSDFPGDCSGGFPNVCWPMVGHAVVANYTLRRLEKDGICAYEKVFGPRGFPGTFVFWLVLPQRVRIKCM